MNTILFSVVILVLADNRFDFLTEHRIVSNLAKISMQELISVAGSTVESR